MLVISFVIGYLIILICVLVSVAFLTLLERKILGYIQVRKGPNKVGMVGMLQPFSDAIKLFSKEQSLPYLSNFLMYFFSPVFSLGLALCFWMIFPIFFNLIDFELGLLFFLCVSSLSVYTLMGAGWSSNSKYAMLGAYRAVAQTISYEVSLALIMLSCVVMVESYDLVKLSNYQDCWWLVWGFFPLFLVWFSSCLAETNRSPFDFAEGESELVSGFNVEYSSGGFALIFMAEYANIMFVSLISVFLFFGGMIEMLVISIVILSMLFLWVRGTFPRFRYDKLMGLAWKIYLPLALNYLLFSFSVCYGFFVVCM
uniref:NADH-ubiquinone oxidoreductase chain 1 n=1 Tax=Carcinoscorpius rotundicauda TaxID=6848 RepID=K7QG86_CARRO|nr:NADH dehydrogenase subunit 1 [Carcinoscorpius rotundicauda]AFT65398.1 NADH dehydrogenase subunit 1 [Carcinoscorpius rotundicauda]